MVDEPMKEKEIDALDKALLATLSKDGRMPIQSVGQSLGVTNPTVRSRLAALVKSKILNVAGLVDTSKVDGIITAFIGITLDKYNLQEKLEQISCLEGVNWAAVVTGRYDVIVEIISTEGMAGLYDFLNEKLDKLGGIKSSESFVVLKARRKWAFLPDSVCKSWLKEHLKTKED